VEFKAVNPEECVLQFITQEAVLNDCLQTQEAYAAEETA
jgi:hypothetical protein